MDSDASFYAISCTDKTKNFQAENFEKVRLADDDALDIAGKVYIDLQTTIGTT